MSAAFYRSEPLEMQAESREQRAESREQRVESREQRAESREQRPESREQRAESREQRAESREQRADTSHTKWQRTISTSKHITVTSAPQLSSHLETHTLRKQDRKRTNQTKNAKKKS